MAAAPIAPNAVVEFDRYVRGWAAGTGLPVSLHRDVVDYREVLSASDFAVYSDLREWRKSVASEEGVPVYQVCSPHCGAVESWR